MAVGKCGLRPGGEVACPLTLPLRHDVKKAELRKHVNQLPPTSRRTGYSTHLPPPAAMHRPEVTGANTDSPTTVNTGVKALVAIPSQATAGPYPGDIQLGMNATDATSVIYFLKVKLRKGKIVSVKSDVSLSWMLYVKPARDKYEQNLEAFRDANGRIFFRASRNVEADEQLFVWYSDQFAREIGIPPLTPNNIMGNQHYLCNKCTRRFEYPNPLKAHMRFRCAKSKAEILSGLLDSPPSVNHMASPWLQLGLPEKHAVRQLFPPQQHPADLSPRKTNCRRSVESPDTSTPSSSTWKSEHQSSTNTKCPPEHQPSVRNLSEGGFKGSLKAPANLNPVSTATTMTLPSPQPIQIFNHIHPPAIPFPLDHHALKFYYPFYGMHPGMSGFCCGRVPPGPFEREMVPYPFSSDSGPHHASLHPSPTDLSLKHKPKTNVSQPTTDKQYTFPMTSPGCPANETFPYPMPSEKAGEPLDLLPRHLYLSKSRKGHLCIYCGKLYSRKYGLKIHLRTHTGYKPLKCKVCLRPFGDPSNLNKHIRLHAEGETPYRCEFCGKVLVRRRDLVRHIKSRHPNEANRAEEIESNKEHNNLNLVKSESIDVAT